jgi:DNA-directed RNA polymerase specialized sigma24 family protein
MTHSRPSSDTEWIDRLKAGDRKAVEPLWNGYYKKLVRYARERLQANSRVTADEEDVAVSAFDSFFRGAAAGRFPRLNDRGDLWQILIVIAARKSVSLQRREIREKRGGGRVVRSSQLEEHVFDQAGTEPTPEFAAVVAEECRRLLEGLGDDSLRAIAVWRMEGFTNAEIAARIGRVEGTVERKLALIRDKWRGEVPK